MKHSDLPREVILPLHNSRENTASNRRSQQGIKSTLQRRGAAVRQAREQKDREREGRRTCSDGPTGQQLGRLEACQPDRGSVASVTTRSSRCSADGCSAVATVEPARRREAGSQLASDRNVLDKTIAKALSGKGAHVEGASVLQGLDWKLAGARPDGVPHSVFQLANHMIYWHEWVVKWLDGNKPRPPKHATGGWPGRQSPSSRREWERTTRRFGDAIDALDRRSREGDPLTKHGKITRLEMLLVVASHASYHIGQVALLRQQLGSWPPPSGGVTW